MNILEHILLDDTWMRNGDNTTITKAEADRIAANEKKKDPAITNYRRSDVDYLCGQVLMSNDDMVTDRFGTKIEEMVIKRLKQKIADEICERITITKEQDYPLNNYTKYTARIGVVKEIV